MTKEEIIEAINSTIIANGQKGITAESLSNLLIDMVSATPEIAGDSGGMLFYVGMPNEDYSEFDLTEEEREHNVNMYNTFIESPCAPISLDMTREYMGMMGVDVSMDDFKMILTAKEIMYASASISQEIFGDPQGGIILEDSVIVHSDGSLSRIQ